MRTLSSLFLILAVAGCALDSSDDPELGSWEQALTASRPMGFARATGDGAVTTAFNSTGGTVTVSRAAAGEYTVNFVGLGLTSSIDGASGNVQLAAEGASNVRCLLIDWTSTAPTVIIHAACSAPDGTPSDTAFAVLFVRDTIWPTVPNTWPTQAAYTRVSSAGRILLLEDFNSSGTHNSVTRRAGRAIVTVPNATGANASIMVTSNQGIFAGAPACSLVSWIGTQATVECRSPSGVLVNGAFTLLYSVTGPTVEQQGAHAAFDGTAVDASRSFAIGKLAWCSPASVTGSRSGSLATIVVAGDLGAWDTGPFLRASFATRQGPAGYCKVESMTVAGTVPSTTATTRVRCYSATGAVVTVPVFTFTHATSDLSGPC